MFREVFKPPKEKSTPKLAPEFGMHEETCEPNDQVASLVHRFFRFLKYQKSFTSASASKTAITLVGFKHQLLCCGSDYLISMLQVCACVLSGRILSSTFSCQLLNYRKIYLGNTLIE
jgi:hypothetical protein